MWKHAFIGTNIDGSKVHEEARKMLTDRYSPWSTVVHTHKSTSSCKGHEHTVYAHEDQTVHDKIFVEDGNAMWGIKDPFEKE